MGHRFLRYFLICCLILPSAACAGDGSDDRNDDNGGNDDDGSKRPYSEMMYVKRQGDDLYISAKMDASTDILYWFKRCLFNEVYTFYRVGTRSNTDRMPTTRPESEPDVVLNLAYSDNIGPFSIQGGGWCGANHKYMERTARTAYNKDFSVTVDGQPLTGDKAVWSRQGITIEAENVILDPTHPYKDANGQEELRDELCHEFATYRIFRNNIDVAVRHSFCCKNPVTIAIYYGMQSMFANKTHFTTPDGAYGNWTPPPAAGESSFTKVGYPDFRRFVEKNAKAYQSAFLLPDGLGDHSWLTDSDVMFICASYGKSYHKLISNKPIQNGDRINWRGVYTWFVTPIADDSDVLCYEGVVDGYPTIFIDTRRACEKSIKLPAYLDPEKYEVIDPNDGIRVSPEGTQGLRISANKAGGCVLSFRK